MKNLFLSVSAVFFAIVAVLNILRFIFQWPVIIGPVTIASHVSIWTALIFALLSLFCFIAYKQE